MIKEYPIKDNSREDLVNYICDLHNKVNLRLNKPVFDCKNAFKFWGGECGCSENKSNNNTDISIETSSGKNIRNNNK